MTAATTPFIDKRIVTIGGGTGGFTINSGLHRYPVFPSAICSVFDSGGSTGRLRDEFGALPQGDIRRCLLALADQKGDLRELFNYRFEGGNGTSGITDHSVGNLLLFAAEKLWGRIEGTRRVADMLGVRGEVLPVSIDDAHLIAELSDGMFLRGETNIDRRPLNDERTIARVHLEPRAYICGATAEAIRQADLIVIGPGDLYTSVIPNFLVVGVAEAIRNSKAKVVFVSNLMDKWGETQGFSVEDFVETLLSYDIGRDRIDVLLVNDHPIPNDLLAYYRESEKSLPIAKSGWRTQKLESLCGQIQTGDFLNQDGLRGRLIRHDPEKLARAIVGL